MKHPRVARMPVRKPLEKLGLEGVDEGDGKQDGGDGFDARHGQIGLVCPAGLEPATPSLEGWCSIQLSYGQEGPCWPMRGPDRRAPGSRQAGPGPARCAGSVAGRRRPPGRAVRFRGREAFAPRSTGRASDRVACAAQLHRRFASSTQRLGGFLCSKHGRASDRVACAAQLHRRFASSTQSGSRSSAFAAPTRPGAAAVITRVGMRSR